MECDALGEVVTISHYHCLYFPENVLIPTVDCVTWKLRSLNNSLP